VTKSTLPRKTEEDPVMFQAGAQFPFAQTVIAKLTPILPIIFHPLMKIAIWYPHQISSGRTLHLLYSHQAKKHLVQMRFMTKAMLPLHNMHHQL